MQHGNHIVNPAAAYEQRLAQHYPSEYLPASSCSCSHGHQVTPPVQQNITIHQADKVGRYMVIGFAGAGIFLMVVAGAVVTLIALGIAGIGGGIFLKAARSFLDSFSDKEDEDKKKR